MTTNISGPVGQAQIATNDIAAGAASPGGNTPVAPRPGGGRPTSERVGQVLRWLGMVVFALLFLYPFAWLLAASLKPRGEVFDNRLIPKTFSPQNYVEVWDQLPLLAWVGNSLLIAVLSAGIVTLVSSMVAFGFAYFRFPGRRVLFSLLLASMMLPGAVTLIPNYLIWKTMGWIGTNVPLWGGALFGSAFYIFLMRQFYLSLPRDLFEAARVDGCSYFGLFTRIAFPLALPSSIIVFIFEFQASWNNFAGPLIYLSLGDPTQYTVPLGIKYAMTLYSPTAGGQGDYQYVMVASLLVTLPMMIMFAFGQRYFIEGVAATGVKG